MGLGLSARQGSSIKCSCRGNSNLELGEWTDSHSGLQHIPLEFQTSFLL